MAKQRSKRASKQAKRRAQKRAQRREELEASKPAGQKLLERIKAERLQRRAGRSRADWRW